MGIIDNDIKILKLLLERKEDRFTIRGISQLVKINYRIAYERIAVLEKEGLIRIIKVGNSKLCEFTYMFNNKVYEAEYLRRLALFKDKNFLIIQDRLAELNSTFIALLFGSFAKGTADKNSDIDILIIGGNEKQIRANISLLPNKIHLTHVTPDDFIEMARRKDFSVVSEAVKNSIILIGIEDYYRLLKNAGN